jgi:hypothetical protein
MLRAQGRRLWEQGKQTIDHKTNPNTPLTEYHLSSIIKYEGGERYDFNYMCKKTDRKF